MDYRELLKRYIEHILEIEGRSFIDSHTPSSYDIQLTDEERNILNELRKEVADAQSKNNTTL